MSVSEKLNCNELILWEIEGDQFWPEWDSTSHNQIESFDDYRDGVTANASMRVVSLAMPNLLCWFLWVLADQHIWWFNWNVRAYPSCEVWLWRIWAHCWNTKHSHGLISPTSSDNAIAFQTAEWNHLGCGSFSSLLQPLQNSDKATYSLQGKKSNMITDIINNRILGIIVLLTDTVQHIWAVIADHVGPLHWNFNIRQKL